MLARHVDPQRAAQVAKAFVSQRVGRAAAAQEPVVAYIHHMPKSGQPAMYVVNAGSAFVIVAADDVAHPVLGYNMGRPWPTPEGKQGAEPAKLPSQVSSFLDDLAAQIEAAREQQTTPDSETAAEWGRLLTANLQPQTTALPDSVGPLLTTTWDQGQYYNALCPEAPNGPDGHAYTGCVATAMAQIINYWGYPIHGRGTHSYESNYGTLTVNYDSATYDYVNMPAALTAASTPAQVNAVAKLMYDCGVANWMMYGTSESGAARENIRMAFINSFSYPLSLGYAERYMYDADEWDSILRKEIGMGQPVYYIGENVLSAHAFVLDGYKQDGFYHINFGWSGQSDGWYLTTAINPSFDFNYWQTAIVGIKPDSAANAVLCHSVPAEDYYAPNINQYYTVSTPLHLYNTGGYNDYRMNYYYGGWCNPNILHFSSGDSTTQLVLDVFEIEEDCSLAVYDGDNMDSLLVVFEPMGIGYPYANIPEDSEIQQKVTNDFSPLVSSRNGFTVVSYSNGFIPKQIHVRVSLASDCRIVSDVAATKTSLGYVLSWQGHGDCMQWQVAWGDTLVTCDTPTLLIDNIVVDESTEIRIRQICGDSIYGEWVPYILNNKHYWSDYVTSVPNGFVYNNDTIIISTAEGLAWLSREYDYGHQTLVIDADIDMGDHMWKSISYYGKVIGNGHTISNIITDYYLGGNGLFNYFEGDTIIDLHTQNAVLCGEGGVGGLVGTLYHAVIINCSATNYRCRGKHASVGGLVGYANCSKIINCYAVGENYSAIHNGGIVGMACQSIVNNCYSSQGSSFQWALTNGLISGYDEGAAYSNCYADNRNTLRQWDAEYDSLATLAYFFGTMDIHGMVSNVATFRVEGDTIGRIVVDTSINYILNSNLDLTTALNNHVVICNSSNMRLWVWNESLHLPAFGNYYEPSCPNVSSLDADCITKNGSTMVALSWMENGDAKQWQVKYKKENTSDDCAFVYFTDVSNDTLYGLTLGYSYDFFVRPICGGEDTVGWGEPTRLYVDMPYWTDIVTSQPEGYRVDGDGNIHISSPEALSWLSSVVNGINDGSPDGLDGINVLLENDIDLSGYQWYPIASDIYPFEGNFNGQGYTITGIYINSSDFVNVGLFGLVQNGTLENCVLEDGTIVNTSGSSEASTGGIVGRMYSGEMSNCHVSSMYIHGDNYVGGLCGEYVSHENAIINSSAHSFISAKSDVGGLIGRLRYASLINSYATGTIELENGSWGSGGIVGCLQQGTINNCYGDVGLTHLGEYEYSGQLVGCNDLGSVSFAFAIDDTTEMSMIGTANLWEDESSSLIDTAKFNPINLQLLSSVSITNNSYTDLLSALNAWVDAYDTAGFYRHWAADSTGENGGFPVFAAIPCNPTSGSDSIVVCDSYTWKGVEYTSSATLMDTITNMEGCDSIVTHYLVVNHGFTSIDTVSAMESYSWADTVLTTSGIYQRTWSALGGCDSIATLWLTLTRTQRDTVTLTVTYTLVHIDTTYITVHDTMYINIHDTTMMTEYVPVHDTTYVEVPYQVHDTTYINVHDTVVVYQTDTLWLTDTVHVHDTIYITQDGIGDVENTDVKLYSHNGVIVVEGAAGREVRLYDVVGRQLATRRELTDGEVRLQVMSSGTYLVQVDGLPARRIVVVK